MGGMGSGREAEVYSGTVEESLHLDVNLLVREGTIRKQCQTSGEISWTRFGSTTSAIGYEAVCELNSGYLRLHYTISHLVLGQNDIAYYVDLITTKPNYGGVRWWFICPNQDCDSMVVKLYQPPGAKYFLCRACQNLTYKSCRDSHKSNPFYEQIASDTGLDIRQVKQIYKKLLTSA